MDTFDRVLRGAVRSAGGVVTLPWERRVRSRQRVTLDDGTEALLALPRGTVLRDGDVLTGDHGRCVRVCAAAEAVSVAHAEDGLALLRAAYHLGNRHVVVQLGSGWLRYLHDHVLDEMVRGLGLKVETHTLPFEPEAGAYEAGTHAHGHGHGH
jgi:urease accessory protein